MNLSTLSVGQKIRLIRETVGLSRPKFAELLGVPPTTLKNYELGVITSYSIHYTKLYEQEAGGQGRGQQDVPEPCQGVQPVTGCGKTSQVMYPVITSYSIHYTKLYE